MSGRRGLGVLLAFGLLPPLSRSPAVAQTGSVPSAVSLDSLLARYAEYGFSGTVLVARKGRVILERGYGMANRERAVPNTPATLFEMNSLTKIFTAAAVLELEEAGKLRTSDPIGRFLGPMPPSKAGATIDHLATHTAGLVPEGTDLDGSSRAAFIKAVKQVPIESAPGKAYRYTNAGYSLLAAIVEVAAADSFNGYLRRHFFRPAGLNATGFRSDFDPEDRRLAEGYAGTPGANGPAPPNPYVWGTIGAGGIVATVRDMYRWTEALRKGSIISAEQRRKMFQRRPAPREGYGWHVEGDETGDSLIHKGGGSDSFASQILYYPREELTIVWATNNLVQRWRQTLNRRIPAAVRGDTITIPPPVVRADRKALERLAGSYSGSGGAVVELRVHERYLYAGENDAGVPADVMFLPQAPFQFTGFNPRTGQVYRLRFEEGPDRTFRARLELPGGEAVTLTRR